MFQFCKHQEQDTLKDLFNQDDDHQELGNFYVKASYKEKVRSDQERRFSLRDFVFHLNNLLSVRTLDRGWRLGCLCYKVQ